MEAKFILFLYQKSIMGLLISLDVLSTGIRYEYFQYDLEDTLLPVKESLILYQYEIEYISNKRHVQTRSS
jgi:hypothetical protein